MKLVVVLAQFAALLLASCGEKNEPAGETTPAEGKQRDLKEVVRDEKTGVELSPKLEGVNLREFELRGEDILYLKGSDSPYTGKYFTLYENGQKESAGNIKEGKEDGLTVEWYRNGQKKSETNWQNGKIVLEKDWSKNGEEIETEADK